MTTRLGAYLARKPTADTLDAPRDVAPPERGQHGQDMQIRDGTQSVRYAVAALLADRTIGEPERRAADRWYRDYALAIHGAADPADGAGSGGASGWIDAKVAAGRAHDAARDALGCDGYALLVACVAEGLSVRSLASGGASRDWLSGFLAATLRTLSHHYAAVDGSRRKPSRAPGAMEHGTHARE